MRVRLTAARVLLSHWWEAPPQPRDVSATIRRTWRVLLDSGPVGLLKTINAGVHELAREGARDPLDMWLHLGRVEYRKRWIPRFDRLSGRDIQEVQAATALLPREPLLSVLMPVYNSDERWLRAAITSVQDQI